MKSNLVYKLWVVWSFLVVLEYRLWIPEHWTHFALIWMCVFALLSWGFLKKTIFVYYCVCGIVFLCFASLLLLSIRTRLFPIYLLTLGMALFGLVFLYLLYLKFHLSYVDSRMRWYQGLPEPIPGLHCELLQGDQSIPLVVCRLDREGTFLFRKTDPPLERALDSKRLVELVFYFKGKKIRSRGILKKWLPSKKGAGIKFCNISPDTKKELGDFVEHLKGEGYVL